MCFIAIKKETPSIHSCELNEEWNINNLPNQIMVKAISDGFVFNILCVDETTCSNSSLFYILFYECEICLKLTLVERASFDDQINNDNSCKIIGNFIDTQLQSCLNEELKIKRNLLNYHDTFIHILFIFYSSNRLFIKNV
ncbi:unnamed protein product [Rotaria magnacalcarata]|uniref:Septin-type G domain-containing protein n=1 Tax=Rotaria magnacalcarata TaxID=392030 RepID=A0A819KR15_9BILA|nr:unnamed protein product [Rotaria magnacalcarata]CAF4056311.1 unnamed protein product [Rotaria magnacalcarata]